MAKFKEFVKGEFYEVPHRSGNSKILTKIPPTERSFKNLPRRSSDNKAKANFKDWLEIESRKIHSDDTATSFGKAANGKWYGWSHRAVSGFKAGDEIKVDTCGNDTGKPFTLKNDKDAMNFAIAFAKDVS